MNLAQAFPSSHIPSGDSFISPSKALLSRIPSLSFLKGSILPSYYNLDCIWPSRIKIMTNNSYWTSALPSSVYTDHMARVLAAWAACRSLGRLHTLSNIGISHLLHHTVNFSSFASTPSPGLIGPYTWQIVNKSQYTMALSISLETLLDIPWKPGWCTLWFSSLKPNLTNPLQEVISKDIQLIAKTTLQHSW